MPQLPRHVNPRTRRLLAPRSAHEVRPVGATRRPLKISPGCTGAPSRGVGAAMPTRSPLIPSSRQASSNLPDSPATPPASTSCWTSGARALRALPVNRPPRATELGRSRGQPDDRGPAVEAGPPSGHPSVRPPMLRSTSQAQRFTVPCCRFFTMRRICVGEKSVDRLSFMNGLRPLNITLLESAICLSGVRY